MKYLFVIGEPSDFDSEQFRAFLTAILESEGKKPFKMFLYKFNKDILSTEFPYLCLEGTTRKGLGLYPNIIMKCIDMKLPEDKEQFRLFIGQSLQIKAD